MNRIPSYRTNFTSTVYITGIKGASECIKNFYTSPKFLEELEQLENNCDDNIVEIHSTHSSGRIVVRVLKDRKISSFEYVKGPYSSEKDAIMDNETLSDAYKACLANLKYQTWDDVPKKIAKYVIS